MVSVRCISLILLLLKAFVIYTTIKLISLSLKEIKVNQTDPSNKVVIGAVCCRRENDYKYIEQTIVMLKSVIISAKLYKISAIEIHLFLEHLNEDEPYFRREILEKMAIGSENVEIILQVYSAVDVIPLNYRFHMIYHQRFRCGYVRFFFPEALPNVDSIIHLDSDMIVTGNLTKHWNLLSEMDDYQMVAMGNDFPMENDQAYRIYQSNFGKVPHVTPIGVNDGLLVMNLTRMRHFRMQEKLLQIYFDYSQIDTELSSQHVFNILLYFNPGLLKVIPCNLHFLESFCENGFYCKEALKDPNGVHLIHGTDGRFMEGRIFNPVYSLYQQLNVSDFTKYDLVKNAMEITKRAFSASSDHANNQCYGTLDKVLYKTF